MELTELEKKVILTLAQRGPMSGYDFHLGGKRKRGNRKALMSSGYWQKIKASLGPEGKGLIDRVHVKRTKSRNEPRDERGRRKDLYWLTFKGLILALRMGAIEPKRAHDIRVKYGVELPAIPEFKRVVEFVEENWGVFYFFFKIIHFDENIDMELATSLIAQLTLIWLNEKHPHLIEKYIKGNNLELPNGVTLEDWKEIGKNPFMKKFLETWKRMLPQIF